jgi:hypothetical protein
MRILYVKLPAIAVAAALLLASLASCEEQIENIASGNIEPSGISVNFGDGEDVWSASYSEWTDYRERYNEVNLYIESPTKFPTVIGSVIPEGTTLFPDSWDENEYLFFEYYSSKWPLVGAALQDGGINYGDWQAESGTVSITDINDTQLSGTARLVMYDLYDFAVNGNESPETKSLTVTFTNVPIYFLAQFGSTTRSADNTTARTISFKGERMKSLKRN